MIASMIETDRYEPQFDESFDADRFERFSHRSGGDFPVRSHASRTRARCVVAPRRPPEVRPAHSTARTAVAVASNGLLPISPRVRFPIFKG